MPKSDDETKPAKCSGCGKRLKGRVPMDSDKKLFCLRCTIVAGAT